jgi:FKBP-type peptidyl-prolyl cis-trans isomerase 2
MKKLLVMIMVVAVISLTACGGENLKAFELLERSHEAQADIDSMMMEIDAQISMSVSGMSIDMPMTMHLEIESEDRLRMDMNMSMMGMDIETTTFLRDGYTYSETNLLGEIERARTEADRDSSMEIAGMLNTSSITKDMLEDSSAESTDDGYHLEFTLNNDGIMTLLGDLNLGDSDMTELFDFDAEELKDADVIMVMHLDEDYLPISVELNMEVEMTVEGMDTTMTINMTMTTIQFGHVTIDFPDWLDEIN